MNKLTRRVYFCLAAAAFGTVSSIAMMILRPPCWKLSALIALSFTLTAAFIFIKAKKSAAAARLIVDNQIIHIKPAVIKEKSEEKGAATFPDETMEIFVSCFGILLNAKMIKFNRDGIRLKTVEFGHDDISFTYGNEKWTRNIRLLRPGIDASAMAKISERFRYETGIIPTLYPDRQK